MTAEADKALSALEERERHAIETADDAVEHYQNQIRYFACL